MHTIQDLRVKQALPLDIKINMTKQRIREWVSEFGIDGVYVSFSGGKDSTVLLHIARQIYPDIKAVFVDTGLEYPEIRQFVKTFDNVDWIKPKMNFKQVIEKYGYPFISKRVCDSLNLAQKVSAKKNIFSEEQLINADINALDERLSMLSGRYNEWYKNRNGKNATKDGTEIRNQSKYAFMIFGKYRFSSQCCNVMKKNPMKAYSKATNRFPITAQMASESELRTQQWLLHGCNGFEMKSPISNPMSFWTEQDILRYIKDNGIEICSIYGDIVPNYDDTEELDGQMDICDLGLAEDTRPLKTTGCKRTGCMFCGYGCHLEKEGNGRFEQMKGTHPKQYDYIMRSKEQGGLGYKEVIDWINEHGNLNIKY